MSMRVACMCIGVHVWLKSSTQPRSIVLQVRGAAIIMINRKKSRQSQKVIGTMMESNASNSVVKRRYPPAVVFGLDAREPGHEQSSVGLRRMCIRRAQSWCMTNSIERGQKAGMRKRAHMNAHGTMAK